MESFLDTCETILHKKNLDLLFYKQTMITYAHLVLKQLENPYSFPLYHEAIRSPIDHYALGNTILRPLIDFPHSTVKGKENIKTICEILERKENVFLFANHQIEADPQAISLLLEKEFPKLAEEMIFVAGERVVTDPLAVPFSLGRNLFCIYSKKYFEKTPERKSIMIQHNQNTLTAMVQKLSEGGKCIYVAPSGGRDRKGPSGKVEVAPFDPQSIELMYLLGQKAKCTTHFFPLALSTHDVLPPPEEIQVDLGEARPTKEAPIHLFFGEEIDMEKFSNFDTTDKKLRRVLRSEYIYQLVLTLYNQL